MSDAIVTRNASAVVEVNLVQHRVTVVDGEQPRVTITGAGRGLPGPAGPPGAPGTPGNGSEDYPDFALIVANALL